LIIEKRIPMLDVTVHHRGFTLAAYTATTHIGYLKAMGFQSVKQRRIPRDGDVLLRA
jgi:hypothetical protein